MVGWGRRFWLFDKVLSGIELSDVMLGLGLLQLLLAALGFCLHLRNVCHCDWALVYPIDGISWLQFEWELILVFFNKFLARILSERILPLSRLIIFFFNPFHIWTIVERGHVMLNFGCPERLMLGFWLLIALTLILLAFQGVAVWAVHHCLSQSYLELLTVPFNLLSRRGVLILGRNCRVIRWREPIRILVCSETWLLRFYGLDIWILLLLTAKRLLSFHVIEALSDWGSHGIRLVWDWIRSGSVSRMVQMEVHLLRNSLKTRLRFFD